MADRPVTSCSPPNLSVQPRLSSVAQQGARADAIVSPNAVSIPTSQSVHLLQENDPALKIVVSVGKPFKPPGNNYDGQEMFDFSPGGADPRRHAGIATFDPAASRSNLTSPVPELHRQADHQSGRDTKQIFVKGPEHQEILKAAGATSSYCRQEGYTPVAPVTSQHTSIPQSSFLPNAPGYGCRIVSHNEVRNPTPSSARRRNRPSLPCSTHRPDFPQHPSKSDAEPSSTSRHPSRKTSGHYSVARRPDRPSTFRPSTGFSQKSRQHGGPVNDETRHGYYNRPDDEVQVPLTRGLLDGTTEVAANESLSILPPNKPSLSTLPIRASGNSNQDIIAPFSDSKPSKLNSAPLRSMRPALRSKPVEAVVGGHPQSSKPSTSSAPKGTVNLDNVRHPEIISDPNDIPDIPRRGQTVTQMHSISDYNTGISRSIGDRTNGFHPGDAHRDKNPSGPGPSQSVALKPADSRASSPATSTANIEDDPGQPATNRNLRSAKQVPSSSVGKAASKPNVSRHGTQKQAKCAQIVDVDSVGAGNENLEVVECGGGGKVRTRLSAMETGASLKRSRTECVVPPAALKAEGEAWMNSKSNKEQFLSALKNALNEHPNIINLSHLALSSADLRLILDETPPQDCDEIDRAFELDNNRITMLTSYACEKLAAYRVDRLNLAINELSEIQGYFSVCNKLRFLNLSRNELKSLPNELSQLEALETLDVSHNHLQELPEKLLRLRKLEILNVAHNELRELPTDLIDCGSKLFALDISYNVDISTLPSCLKLCKDLENLELAGTGLKECLRAKDLSNNVFSLVSMIAGRSEEDLMYRKKEGKFPPVIVTPPRERAGRAAMEREDSKKSALRSMEANEIREVHILEEA